MLPAPISRSPARSTPAPPARRRCTLDAGTAGTITLSGTSAARRRWAPSRSPTRRSISAAPHDGGRDGDADRRDGGHRRCRRRHHRRSARRVPYHVRRHDRWRLRRLVAGGGHRHHHACRRCRARHAACHAHDDRRRARSRRQCRCHGRDERQPVGRHGATGRRAGDHDDGHRRQRDLCRHHRRYGTWRPGACASRKRNRRHDRPLRPDRIADAARRGRLDRRRDRSRCQCRDRDGERRGVAHGTRPRSSAMVPRRPS